MDWPAWLIVEDPTLRRALWVVGVALILVGLLFYVLHRAWSHGDPAYRGDRRRARVPGPYDVDPTTGTLIVTPELKEAADRYNARTLDQETDPTGGGNHVWPVADRSRAIRVPIPRPLEPTRRLTPGWRAAIQSPTGSWTMPNNGRRHHHRATGGRQEETRQLHPGYVAEARARVARGEDPDPDGLLS